MTVIATRTLFIETAEGKAPVAIRLFLPEPDGQYWQCRYEIDWPEGTIKSRAGGNDSLHALGIAHEKIGLDLYFSRYHHERSMHWMKPWIGYGLGLPKGARDLLIGDDERYYGNDPSEKA